MTRTKIFAVCLAVLLLCSPAAFAGNDTLKIGGLFAVTGPASYLGDPEKKSLEMAVDEINAKGGIDGYKLEAVIYDTEADPTKAVTFAQRLINKDGVVAIVGPSTTPTSMAVLPICIKAGVPLISCAAGNGIVLPIKPFVFKTAQSDIQAVGRIYQYMQKNGIKKVAILCDSNGFGQSGREQLKALADKYGFTVVADETYSGKDPDMTTQLTKMRTASPDAMVVWGVGPAPAVIAKNAAQLKIDVPVYMSHGIASPKFIELAGDASQGIIFPTGKILVVDQLDDSDKQKAVLKDYSEKYTKKYNANVSGFGGYAWDAMSILEEALPGTKGDKKKLRDNIEQVDELTAVSGTFNFSPEDHNGLSEDAFVMVQIDGGKWKVLK